MNRVSRRGFIAGSISVVGSGLVVSALSAIAGCTNGKSTLPKGLQLVQRFPQVLVPGSLRLPISLALSSGVLSTTDDFNFPETLSAKIVDFSTDKVVTKNISARLHKVNIPLSYYPFRTTIDTVGNYALVVDGGPSEGTAFSVLARNQVDVPGINDELPGFDTPTFDDHQGVEPICTRQPQPCGFHSVTLRDALTRGVPVAYLVGTPAHCETGTCAPALEGLIEIAQRVGDRAMFIHAEVYADDAATIIADAVTALRLTFEPVLFVTDANGVIVERLDAVFDAQEISDALASVGIN